MGALVALLAASIALVAPVGPSRAGGATPPTPAVLFDNGNAEAVAGNPGQMTVFSLGERHRITMVQTVHGGESPAPDRRTLDLGLRHLESGRTVGPFEAHGFARENAAGGVPGDLYWVAYPNVVITAGTWQILDSGPATWSHNLRSCGGMARVLGYPVAGANAVATSVATSAATSSPSPEGASTPVPSPPPPSAAPPTPSPAPVATPAPTPTPAPTLAPTPAPTPAAAPAASPRRSIPDDLLPLDPEGHPMDVDLAAPAGADELPGG